MTKTLQRKIRALLADASNSAEFILADAKESDLALAGVPAVLERSLERPDASFPYRSRGAYLDQILELIEDSPLDLMVVSREVAGSMAGAGGAFEHSRVSPSVRVQSGRDLRARAPGESGPLPLFGLGLSRDRALDQAELDAYDRFRLDVGVVRGGHLLELYPASGRDGGPPQRVDDVLDDRLLHSLLESPPWARPTLLQVPYYGPRLMERLAGCLPGIAVGVLGGAPGTTFDAFQLLAEAGRNGARAALFGRRIGAAEHQAAFVRLMDVVARREASPAEAVHAYHGVLQGLGIRPLRELGEDLQPSSQLLRGEERSAVYVVVPELPYAPGARGEPAGAGERSSGTRTAPSPPAATTPTEPEPDFDRMTPQEKLDYNQRRRDRIFG